MIVFQRAIAFLKEIQRGCAYLMVQVPLKSESILAQSHQLTDYFGDSKQYHNVLNHVDEGLKNLHHG
ncbi:MAG: hypothetical protein RLO37_00295 [Coleofasciculus chthonoplastes F1-TOW-03]